MLRPVPTLMVSAVCFGAAVLPSQWATGAGLSAAAVVAVRFTVAAAASAPAARRSRFRERPGLYLAAWLLSGGVNTIGFVLLTAALERTTAGRAAFLSSLSVLLVPLLVAVFTLRRPPTRRVLAALVAVVGSLVLTGGGVGLGSGAVLALLTAVAGGCHMLSVSWAAPRLHVATYNLGQIVVVCLVAGALSLRDFGAVTWVGLATAAWCGLAQAAGAALQSRAQRSVDGSTAALVFTLVPVVALVTAWALDGQVPGVAELVGGAVIVLAVVLGEARLGAVRDPDVDGRDSAVDVGVGPRRHTVEQQHSDVEGPADVEGVAEVGRSGAAAGDPA